MRKLYETHNPKAAFKPAADKCKGATGPKKVESRIVSLKPAAVKKYTENGVQKVESRIVSLKPAPDKYSFANTVKKMEPAKSKTVMCQILADLRMYYSASDQVMDMMWEPYPPAYYRRARRQHQHMMAASYRADGYRQ